MERRTLLPAAVLFLAASTSAQTFVVDVNNGPGTNYTSLRTAVDTVPDGSTLLVRPGAYETFTIDGKGLTLLGDQATIDAGPAHWLVEIENTSPWQTVRLVGFEIIARDHHPAAASVVLQIRDCAGLVVLDDIALTAAPRAGLLVVSHADQLCIRDTSGVVAAFEIADSDTVLESCTIAGDDGGITAGNYLLSRPAFRLTRGVLQLAGCDLAGGIGAAIFGGNQPAVELNAGTMRVLADNVLTATAPAPAVGGAGLLRLDPAASLNTAAIPRIGASVSTQLAAMPTVAGTSSALGGVLTGSAIAPAGQPTALFVGLPGAALTVPGFSDPLWLDPTAAALVAFGVPQSGVPLLASIAVPNNAVFRGVTFVWQSFVPTGGAVDASNPSCTLVR